MAIRFSSSIASRRFYELAKQAVAAGTPLATTVERNLSRESIDYDAVYAGRSDWRILPAMDHPEDPAHCLVSGTAYVSVGR
jgi:hypothetical protein